MTPLLLPLHGLGGRQDLPLPFEFVLIGAAAALAVSFAVLLAAWPSPRFGEPSGRPLPRLTRLLDAPLTLSVSRVVVSGLYGLIAAAMLLGQDRVTNPAFGFVYVWVWVGIVPISLLAGRVWRTLNPLRSLARVVTWLTRRPGGVRPLSEQAWQRLGLLPAALGLLGFTWLELVQPDNNTLRVVGAWALAWLVVLLAGVALLGDRWIAAADPFEVFADTIARLSPWQRIGGELQLVNPLRHVATTPNRVGTAAVTAVLLGGTAYDSFSNTSWWIAAVQTSSAPPELWQTTGLLAMVAAVGISFALAGLALGRGMTNRLAAGLIPIVAGYSIAHYLSLLVIEGQRTLIGLSDPLGLGWNLFGTAELGVYTGIFDFPEVTALIQLAAILAGHLIGVLITHEVAVGRSPKGRAALTQVPLLALMIGYTTAGLLLLFSP